MKELQRKDIGALCLKCGKLI